MRVASSSSVSDVSDPMFTRGVDADVQRQHAAASNIHAGISSGARCSSTRHTSITSPCRFMVPMTLRSRPHSGCHAYTTRRHPVLWVFVPSVVQPGTTTPEPAIPDAGGDLAGASMIPMPGPRNEALLNSGTLSPNPWDLTLSSQNVCWRYTEATRTEDKAPQGCDLSADSSVGMAPGGLDAEAVSIQNQTRRILAYCHPRMVLTMGSTLESAPGPVLRREQ